MNTLKVFSEKERAYDVYQARQDFLRQQGAIERERRSIQQALEETSAALAQQSATLAQERAAREEERAARETERQAKEAALGEVERLTALLRGNKPTADS